MSRALLHVLLWILPALLLGYPQIASADGPTSSAIRLNGAIGHPPHERPVYGKYSEHWKNIYGEIETYFIEFSYWFHTTPPETKKAVVALVKFRKHLADIAPAQFELAWLMDVQAEFLYANMHRLKNTNKGERDTVTEEIRSRVLTVSQKLLKDGEEKWSKEDEALFDTLLLAANELAVLLEQPTVTKNEIAAMTIPIGFALVKAE